MGNTINIFNSEIQLPEQPDIDNIQNWGTLNAKEQYWRKIPLPSFFTTVEFDKDGNALLDKQQSDYAREEVRRCKEGYWFLNNGEPTYITGKNYFYLQWWKLEDDIYPDYRDLDRRYFLFLNHWEKTPWCIGILIGKKRRQGATSIATSNLVYECVFFKNSFCGLTSKTQIDAKTAFTNMISFGYRQLPVFLKPKQLNNKDSVSELVFAHKTVEQKGTRANAIDNDTGHRSRIDYRAPSLNAYDSGRLSRACLDEGAKFPKEVPFSTFVSIISKTLVKGIKKVGFIECPSTTNAMSNGGEEFKRVWDNSNQHKYERTPTRLVKYVTPAYDGYMGFIDRYGMSVIDTPNEEQYKYLVENFVGIGDLTESDVMGGAKKYLENKRALLSGTDLEEAIRMEPFNEEEMFMYAGNGCEFNSQNIQNQLKFISDNPSDCFLRRSRLVLKKEIKKSIYPNKKDTEIQSVSAMDDENGGWFFHEMPNIPNKFKDNGGILEPLNANMYVIGVDTTSDNDVNNGSKPRALIMKKSCIVDGEETGMKPVGMWLADKRLGVHFDEEITKAALFFGCKVMYEIDYRDDYIRHFTKNGMRSFLEWTPIALRSPTKKNPRIEPGVRSGDGFQHYQQLQIAKAYIDGDSQDIYNGHVHRIVFPSLLKQLLKFNNNDRTKSDECIALFMALVTMFGENSIQKSISSKVIKLLPQYNIKMVN